MDAIRLFAPAVIEGSVRPPGSKSLTNRALICAAHASGHSVLEGASFSEDTRLLVGGLMRHGHSIHLHEPDGKIHIHPRPAEELQGRASFFLGNAGTALRFLVGYLCTHNGKFLIDGDPRMRQRPIQDLLDALNRLGGNTRSVFSNGCPPVSVDASGLRGGPVTMRAGTSSQFISSILLSASRFGQGVDLTLEGPAVSRPYLRMTTAVLEAFGGSIRATENRFLVRPEPLNPRTYEIEPDASGAAYLMAMAAVSGGTVRIEGLDRNSPQGDTAFADLLESMGCRIEREEGALVVRGGALRGIEADLKDMPDTAQTLAVTALFARGETRIRGIANLRHKETDRIAALERELGRLGAKVDASDEALTVRPPAEISPGRIQTYGDHRMAMSFAIAAVRNPEIELEDPECVSKSYPGFFEVLRRLGIRNRRSG